MKKLRLCFVNMNVKNKLFICFLIVTVILMFIMLFVFYIGTSKIIFEKTIIQSKETIEQITINIEHNFEMMNEKFFYLSFNPIVQKQLQVDTTNLMTMAEQGDAKRALGSCMIQAYTSSSMEDLELVGNNGQSYYISVWNVKKNIPNELELFEAAENNMGRTTIINNSVETGSIQVIKQIKDIVTMRPLGFLRTSIRLSEINKITKNIDFGSEGTVFVLDKNNQLIGDSHTNIENSEDLLKNKSGILNYWIGKQKYILIYDTSSYLGWKIVGMIPMKYLNQKLENLKIFIVILSVLSFAISLLLSRVLARLLVRPINNMTIVLEKVSRGDFSALLPENRKDEIGKMSSIFNYTINKVNYLLNEVARVQLLEKELKFKTLQAQINPHFLYNTLDVINWMARKEGNESICNMVTAVSDLMRISISNRENIITIKSELKYVKDYLYIQKVRYGDRISTSFSIDESILNAKIPKLTLQPLVENAVVHGIEGKSGKGEIYISCQKNGDDILLLVKDTGVGIPKAVLTKLLEKPSVLEENISHTKLGLLAVNERIKYLYGRNYGLQISSEENKWTKVMIRIPYQVDPVILSEKIKDLYEEEKSCEIESTDFR